MPAVAKKSVKVTSSKSDDVAKKPKKQNSKKLQKTVEINAAKKLAKLKSTKAVSDKVNFFLFHSFMVDYSILFF